MGPTGSLAKEDGEDDDDDDDEEEEEGGEVEQDGDKAMGEAEDERVLADDDAFFLARRDRTE